MTIQELARYNPVVRSMLIQGCSHEQIAVEVCEENERLKARVVELLAIAPRKIMTPDGVMVLHCPDELVPMDQLELCGV